MKISILSLFPDTINTFIGESIVKRAQLKNTVEIEVINIRDYAIDSYGSVDDKPYGGGAGMVMRIDVIAKALQETKHKSGVSAGQQKTVLTTPRGRVFNQQIAQSYATDIAHLIILCGHYEGFDERVIDIVDDEISLGDFVMTGGEITAAAIVDAVVRLLPGAIKKDSPEEESFSEVLISTLVDAVGKDETIQQLQLDKVEAVRLLEYPHYTRPEEFDGKKVPAILLSGNHKEIEKWRISMAYNETKKRRPDLLKKK